MCARVPRAAIADSPESPVAARVFARYRRLVCGSSCLQTRGRRSVRNLRCLRSLYSLRTRPERLLERFAK